MTPEQHRIAELEQLLKERDAYIELLKSSNERLSRDNERLFIELERVRRAIARPEESTTPT